MLGLETRDARARSLRLKSTAPTWSIKRREALRMAWRRTSFSSGLRARWNLGGMRGPLHGSCAARDRCVELVFHACQALGLVPQLTRALDVAGALGQAHLHRRSLHVEQLGRPVELARRHPSPRWVERGKGSAIGLPANHSHDNLGAQAGGLLQVRSPGARAAGKL